MKKHLCLLMLIAALVVPWASRAQAVTLGNYAFSTGVDATKWVSMTGATQILTPSNSDGMASSVQSIGFSFPFGSTNYTQYSVNTDGNLRLGSTVTGTANYSTPFSSANAAVNNPKINAFGCDGYGVTGSHYVKAKQHVTDDDDTLLAVEFCMGTYTSSTRNYLYKWQVHLYKNGNIEIVFPAASGIPSTAPAVSHQCGMCVSASDGWIISSATNTAQHFTNGSSVTNASGTWFGANRYYAFIHPSNLSCPGPLALTVSNITTDSAIVTWSPGGTETEWVYSLNGADWEYVYDTAIVFDTLRANTPYTISVRGVCGYDDTSFASSISFRTACTSITLADLPFTENFDGVEGATTTSVSENNLPPCWDHHNTGTNTSYSGYPMVYATSGNTHSGANAMRFYTYITSGTYANQYAIFPEIDSTTAPINTLQVDFWSRSGSSSYQSYLIVGVMTDPTNPSTFVPMDTIYSNASTTYTYHEVQFNTYTGPHGRITFMVPQPASNYNTMLVDDITVRVIPTCFWPSAVALSSISSDEATIVWTPDSRTANPSSWVVEYDTAGFTPGTGITTTMTDTTIALTGLNPNTQYDIYIRANCGVGDESDPTTFSFRTDCLGLDTLPYLETFESYGSSSTSPISTCWHKGTNSTTAYPYPSSTVVNGTRSLYFYGYYPSSATADRIYSWATLPAIDDALSMSDLMLRLKVKRGSTASNYYTTLLYIGVADSYVGFVNADSIAAQVTWIDTLDYFSTAASSIHDAEVGFANYTGTGKYVVIYAPVPPLQGSASYCYNYVYVDDVELLEAPNCNRPTAVALDSVTSDEAYIRWTPNSFTTNPSSWEVEYDTVGFTPGTGATMTVYDTMATLTGLAANTQYVVYIKANCGGDMSDSTVFTFRTACGALTTLPYTEDFESYGSGTTAFPTCWYKLGSTADRPYIYATTSYGHNNSHGLYFYAAAGGYCYAIMPSLDSNTLNISTLQVSFWARQYSTTYNCDFEVGVMTDPTDASTFTAIGSVHPAGTTYEHFEVALGTYTGSGSYIAFRAIQHSGSSSAIYLMLDDVTLEPMPTCPGITDLDAATTVGAALLTWNHQAGYGDPDGGYQVTYDSIGGTSPATVLATEPTATLTGLQPRTTYKAYVQADCGNDGLGRRDSIEFTTGPNAYIDITDGTPGTSYYLPIGNFYKYSYTQQIITAAEMGGAATLTGIDFQYSYATAVTQKTNVTIYLANTTTSSLSSAFVTYNANTFVPVYTGNMNCTQGWNHFQFTTPFQYDGTSNLLVVVHDNSNAYPGSSYIYATHSAPAGSGRYVQNDSSPYTISSVSGGTSLSYRANMHIYKVDNGTIACAAPAVRATYVSQDTVELAWIPGYNETEWDVDYRVHGTTTWTSAATGVTTTNYTFDNLNPGTDYDFRVSFTCTDDNTLYAGTVSARTHCAAVSIPYSYNFDDLPTGSSSARPDIPCWHHLNNGTSYFGYPYVYSTAHSGTRSLYWYSTTTTGTYGDYQVVVLPPMDTTTTPISGMQLSFWARPSSTSYAPVFFVGVMTDPENISTFQVVDTVNVPSGSIDWTFYEVPLNSYHGNGNYIAVRVNRPSSSWYAYTDDFMVDAIPTCPHVANVAVDTATENSITLSWHPVGEETEWSITDGAGFYVTTLDTFYTVTGLYPNTAYNFEVRALCSSTDSSIAMSVLARTSCPQHITLPYLEDFETYGTGSTAFPSCWHRLGSTADRPYVNATTSYGHNNTHGLYFYAASGGYCYGILPPVESTLLTTLEVNFWARQYSTSYNCDFVVGVMTDPLDATTFVAVDTVHPAGTTYEEFTVSLANYTGTGTYIAFSSIQHPGTSTTIYMMLDDVEVYQSSNCPSVEGLYASSVSNNNATVAWTVPANAGHTGVMLYIATVNNIAAATDSAFVPAGTNSYTFTGLHGTTTYYVWARTECATESARVRTMNFTTTADCVPVSNVTVAGLDYTAFGLTWDAPTAGNAATAYRVYWKATTATTWDSMVVTTNHCYINGLTANTSYQYRILTLCSDLVSEANSGTISTPACGTMITEGGASNSYLPTYVYYNYSYTQQIYLAEELGDIDTIGAITYYYQGTLTIPRSMTIYMANTTQSAFGSSADYVPASALTQVFNGTMNGTSGFITVTLTTPFVRTPGSNLVIACNDLTGDYETSASWNATATSTTRSLYYYWDDDPFSPAAPDADASNGVLSYVNQIVLTKPNCTVPTCGTPILFTDSATTTSIFVSWHAETGHTYNVAYRATGDSTWTTVATANTTGTISITGLTPSSEYVVRVSTQCDGATLTGTATVQTLCAPMPLPLTEDFEDRANGVFERYCWTVGTINLGTTYPMPIVTRLQGSEDRLCLIYNGGYVILPEVAEELDSLQIRFKLLQGGENVRFLMGLMLDPAAPITSIHVLDTLIRSQIDSTTNEVNITYQFAGNIPAGYEHAHIAFWDAFNDNYSFLNDIVVEYVPQCTPASDFTVDTVTTTTATISWTNPGRNATSYVVEYGPRYYTPGTGTRVTGNGSPIILTGLDHSTSYDAYVYTVCGASGDTSVASQVIRFTTSCAEITTLPYVMSFENGIVPPGTSPADALPNCWTATGSPLPHVIYTSTGAYTGTASHCFQFNTDSGVAALPQMQPAINTLMMSFRAHNASPANAGLVIGTLNSTNTFVPYDTVDFVGGTNNVYNVVCYFNDYAGTDNRIAMRSRCSSSSNYIYIDDIVVDTLPACIPVSHLHAEMLQGTSAYLVWSRSTAASYTVRYKLHSAATYTDTTTTTRDINLTGLNPQTQYDVMVIGSCNDTATLSFTTPCNAVTLPYTENFDNVSTNTSTSGNYGVMPNCWDYTLTGTSSYTTGSYLPGVYYGTTYAHSGSYSLRIAGVGYFMLPPMPVDLDTLELKLWHYTASANYAFEVGVMEGNTFIPVQTITSPTSTKTQHTVYFATYHGNSRTIAIRNFYNSSTTTYDYSYNYLDDIQVDFVPSCMPVANVHSVGASTSTIDVDWTDVGTPASQWEVNYGPVGHAAGSGGQTITVSSHPCTISGLDTLTAYDVYVRALCSATDQSTWSTKATLSTELCDGATIASTGTNTATSYNAPVNNFYKYTLSETIIDSAELVGIGDISAIAYSYAYTTASSSKTSVNIYLQPTTKKTFSSTTDVVALNANTAVLVYSGHLNCSNGWNYFQFDTTYTWDGHSNLLVIVDDNSNAYNGSAYIFNTSACTGNKTLTFYSDSENPNPSSPASFGGSKTVYTWRPTMKLVSCGSSCQAPGVTVSDITYQSATVTAVGTGLAYELAYGTDPDNLGAPQTNTTGVFNLTGLSNNTEYFYAVRKQCDDGNWSSAATGNFTTANLPCTAPSNLSTTNVTYTGATLTWTPGNRQTTWEVHLFAGTTVNRYDTVTGTPTITYTDLVEGTTYSMAVRGFCTETEYSDWSDTLEVTTLRCEQVTDITVSNLTATGATLSWPATGAESYTVEYGYQGMSQGDGTSVTVNTNTCVLTGLDRNTHYDAYVRGNCSGAAGVWSAVVSFTTTSGGQGILDADGDQAVVVYPNPASEMVTITAPAASTVTLVDLNGRQSGSWYTEDGSLTIDVSDLAKGAYFVRVTTAEGTAVRKLIVK
ncbi:MAG: fibronectin type III domain-containing protein [Bacteroidales bacterium]|nr:fibronectin type III domain-containing protein [Bacteroidales bacterium]